MTINTINRALTVLFFASSIMLICLNCHTTKTHDGNNQDKVAKEHKDSKEDMEKEASKGKEMDKSKVTDKTTTYKLGDVVPLTVGNTVMVGSEMLKLRLRKVGDSRCPKGVNCMQAGQAKVELMLIKELDMVTNVELNAKGLCHKTDGSCGDSAESQGFSITLVTLTPYPGDDGKTSVPQDQYVANIIVEEN